MKFNSLLFSVLFLSFSSVLYQSCVSEAAANTQALDIKKESEWTNLESAIQLSKTDNKKILIDVYTDWCKWCKVMDEKTFEDLETKAFLSENYHLVKFNAEHKEPIDFNGKTYNYQSNGKRGINSLATELLGERLSYPSLVVLDSDLQKKQTIRGFKSPEQLRELLK